ncbi:MAG: hypothetical protein AAFZ80_01290 [Cyanobacteria bacterium P01_A01_bin.105]
MSRQTQSANAVPSHDVLVARDASYANDSLFTGDTLFPSNLPSEAQQRVYVLDVHIIDGPIDPDFLNNNPIISRRIEMLGIHTLADLHQAIFRAFDRQAQHLYEFQIGGKGPQDPNNRIYGLPEALRREEDETAAGDVEATTLATAGIAVDQPFGYWFDFGDDWWHQVNLVNIRVDHHPESFPRVVGRIGASPPQRQTDEA